MSMIGYGGFGTVYKVQNKYDNKIYAIKIQATINSYRAGAKYHPIAIEEAKNLLLVQSEYVVQYYDSWLEGNCTYIQMELCSQSLRNIMEIKPQVFNRQIGHPMDCVEYFISCEIFRQILESVQYLHEFNPQIIHRGIKPDNILITENVTNGRFIKLCDFGLATYHDKRVHFRTERKHDQDVGDMKYIAPEVVKGEKYSIKADVYCLSLIGGELFEVDLDEINLDEYDPIND
ncbi:unnamed protein product [Oppiella nova]|uniref:Protein kinase domain-containing protein n=1 Tax=Oppiella nova TaxID=334625 RepID=A0A7R9QLZ6_9ACAR|nr:unnamed protein product [Oppiella nova]CAG2168243.1 unnamed protein product [Oppiella nova]